MSLSNDPRWPRAGHWLEQSAANPALTFLGVPAHLSSISPTRADTTPAAVRQALLRYSTFHIGRGVDLQEMPVLDAGDVPEPDGASGEERVRQAIASLNLSDSLLVAIGGDNSITFSVMSALFGEGLGQAGLITLDAHFDLRDGHSNGSPVRRLIEEGGLDPRRVVQIGINDFSNSAEYAQRARDLGITVIPRAELRGADPVAVARAALDIAGDAVYVDLDVDVCDRAVVPGCPAAAPGGLSADELRQFAGAFGADRRVRAIDLTEVDAAADSSDGRTVRLVALCVLEAAAGRWHSMRAGVGS